MKLKLNRICIEKLTVIINQENRKREITTGKWTQATICLDMANKEFWMVLQKHFVPRDMEKISQKLLLQKRQQKTSKELPLIFSDNQRIQDKVKLQDQITFMEFQTFKVTIHGMLLDVFTENQKLEKYYQIKIWENQ